MKFDLHDAQVTCFILAFVSLVTTVVYVLLSQQVRRALDEVASLKNALTWLQADIRRLGSEHSQGGPLRR